jgi:hypothetical protein
VGGSKEMGVSNTRTKKVFCSLKAIVASLIFAAVGFDSKDTFPLVCGYVFGIWSIFLIYFRFRPVFSYNDKYLMRADLKKGFKVDEKIIWKDVFSISSNAYSTMTLINLKNGNKIPLNTLITPNYYKVLKEVVDLLHKNNPNLKIDAETFKILEKSYERKQIFLFILLMFLFFLIWAMMRFHWLAIN